jgi:NitT/TauT family transport system ATP-binding protein
MQTETLNTKSSAVSLDFQDVEKSFPESGPVIKTFNLQVMAGDFISFLGPSGCGKSTLLRLLADFEKVDSGAIKIGIPGTHFKRSFVFQEAHLLPWRTVLKNVCLPLELQNISGAEALAHDALKKVGLSDAVKKYPNQLSGGMKMRVSLARALVTNPDLLLLDEPFAALDETSRHQLQEDLRSLWQERSMTVVFVTHSISEAVFLSNRAVVLSPRPAQIKMDLKLDLPPERGSDLRLSEKFLSEMRKIHAAFN